MNKHTTPAIHAARAIVRGDVQRARLELAGVKSISVTEMRALAGACAEASRRYGCFLDWADFIA